MNKQTYYFTFGVNHLHNFENAILGFHTVLLVQADNMEQAETKIRDKVGLEYSMVYTDKYSAGIDRWHLNIVHIDKLGEKLD